MFDEYAKLEAMDYTVRQIRAMVQDGSSVEDALKSMETEIQMRSIGLSQRLNSLAQVMATRGGDQN